MNTDSYFCEMYKRRGRRARARLQHQMGFLYEGIEFLGARVLDIGGGAGLHSFYALARGAQSALLVEPESDGGHRSMITEFISWREALGAHRAELLETTLQEFSAPDGGYDIVLVQDAINHIDEQACLTFGESERSRAIYAGIFSKIATLVRPGGKLIVADCSSFNVYPVLGLPNPFDPSIEWPKHQPPSVWTRLAENHGFKKQSLRWSTPARFGQIGAVLFGNPVAAWFFTSHFVLQFERRRQ